MPIHREQRTIGNLTATPDTSSAAMVPYRVMETVMRLTLTLADATGGRLLLPERGRFQTQARASLQHEHLIVQNGASLDENPFVSSITHTVVNTGQTVTLDTAGEAAQRFSRYGAAVRLPASAHCVALRHEGRIAAVLYLENERREHAFTEALRTSLERLAPQLAIVIGEASAQRVTHEPEHDPASLAFEPSFELPQTSTLSAIDALLTSVTHEISQPLSAIDASSSAGLRWLQRDTPNLDEAVISLEKVRSCAMRARKIIDDLRSLKNHVTKGR